jgi:serine/threonine protein kinase
LKINNFLFRSKDAAAGMLYLSSQGIVHRDLALRNLLATNATSVENNLKYVIKIADYG